MNLIDPAVKDRTQLTEETLLRANGSVSAGGYWLVSTMLRPTVLPLLTDDVGDGVARPCHSRRCTPATRLDTTHYTIITQI